MCTICGNAFLDLGKRQRWVGKRLSNFLPLTLLRCWSNEDMPSPGCLRSGSLRSGSLGAGAVPEGRRHDLGAVAAVLVALRNVHHLVQQPLLQCHRLQPQGAELAIGHLSTGRDPQSEMSS